MRAAVVTQKDQIEVRDVPEPVTGPYDALCDIIVSSICSGTDIGIVSGDAYFTSDYPLILGHEGVGRVREVGEKVRHLKPGDLVTRVFNRMPEGSAYKLRNGAFAERGFVTDWEAMKEDGLPETEWQPYTVHRVLPPGTDPLSATMIITWRETLAFLKQLELSAGDTLLIIGSGGNALSFVEHGHHLGYRIISVGNTQRRNDFISAGADLALDYKDSDLISELRNEGYESVDAIIDAVGSSEIAERLLPALKEAGAYGLYGLHDFYENASRAQAHKNIRFFNGENYDEGSTHDEVMALIKAGKLVAGRYISNDHVYPLERINDALDASRNRATYKPIIKIG